MHDLGVDPGSGGCSPTEEGEASHSHGSPPAVSRLCLHRGETEAQLSHEPPWGSGTQLQMPCSGHTAEPHGDRQHTGGQDPWRRHEEP